jgi:hypothetical protein
VEFNKGQGSGRFLFVDGSNPSSVYTMSLPRVEKLHFLEVITAFMNFTMDIIYALQ